VKLEKTYEYLFIAPKSLMSNSRRMLASTGWRVVAVVPDGSNLYALMERPL